MSKVRSWLEFFAALLLLAAGPPAVALDPRLDISQYAHTSWKIRDGFFGSYILSIAQAPDGYLWLGTTNGLLRFDGVRAIPWTPPGEARLPSDFIRKLLFARDGSLWIGTKKGLASWKDGRLRSIPELDGLFVGALAEDRDGSIWAGGGGPSETAGRLCEIRSAHTNCFGEDGSLGRGITLLSEDSRGRLWVGDTKGFWRWKPGPPKFYPLPGPADGLVENDDASITASTAGGIWRILGDRQQAQAIPGFGREPLRLYRDRGGALWAGTLSRGLLHVHQGRTDAFTKADGLSGERSLSIFEDREGSIWVSTPDGLDRFRDVAAATLSEKQGLSTSSVSSILVAKNGGVWIGTYDGLNRWGDGQITTYRRRDGLPDDYITSLFEDRHQRVWIATRGGLACFQNSRFSLVHRFPTVLGAWVYAFAEDSGGNLWMSQYGALVRMYAGDVAERVPWTTFAHNDAASTLLFDPAGGGIWLGFQEGGVAYLKDGRTRASWTSADGFGAGNVAHLRLDPGGALWAATAGGLSRIKDGHVSNLTRANGLPCDTVHWSLEDNDGSLWLYTACSLVRIKRDDLLAWVADPRRVVQVTVFDASDGIRSDPFLSGATPIVGKTGDGRLWFLLTDGVSVIDPRHLPFNKLPPPVRIEQITADRQSYGASADLRLPPLIRDLQIDYTALSLAAPEKVQFRYKLEGRDRDWQNPGNRRQAFYADLPPGQYRFRVIASNNSGVWNEQGDVLDFSIAPAYWQTNWFRALGVAAFLGLLWLLYHLRLRQLAQRFNLTLDARVGERTRIARELHDTLLQSFQGLLLRFQTASELLPRRPDEAKQTLDGAIDRAAQAITEGRDAVQGLRASVAETNDLALSLRTFAEELGADGGSTAAGVHVVVEGVPRTLHPILRDEVYRIGSEAMRNALRHAAAMQIEVELRYDERQLRLRVRDDGKGIDPKYLREQGRQGHFGLHGMRERAELIGGKLTVWSALDAGTEVELSIPANRAYAAAPQQRRSRLAERVFGKEGQDRS